MSDEVTPGSVVNAMLQMAQKSGGTESMPEVGRFAAYYADQIADKINPENVEAFMLGAAVVNVLTQEAILRVSMDGSEAGERATYESERDFAMGITSASVVMARLVGGALDAVVKQAAEQPVYDREFHGIIEDLL